MSDHLSSYVDCYQVSFRCKQLENIIVNRKITNLMRRYNNAANTVDKINIILGISSETVLESEVKRFLEDNLASTEPAIRFATARALSRVYKDSSPNEAFDILLTALKHPEPIKDIYEKSTMKASDTINDACMALCFFKNTRRDIIVGVLIEYIGKYSRWNSTNMAHALLYMTFDHRPTHQLHPNEVTREQKEVLNLLVSTNRVWRYTANIAESLEQFGLPGDRNQLIQFTNELTNVPDYGDHDDTNHPTDGQLTD